MNTDKFDFKFQISNLLNKICVYLCSSVDKNFLINFFGF